MKAKADMRRLIGCFALLCFITGVAVAPVCAQDKNEKKRQELQKKIEELKRQKVEQQTKFQKRMEETVPDARSLGEVISRYEKLRESCGEKKSGRCADVYSTLAKLYYDKGRDEYIQARARYEKEMDDWERKQVGPEPINPKPDYSESVKMWERLIADYPKHARLDEAYYQLGSINLVLGDLEGSSKYFADVAEKFPSSPRASAANFRLADYAFIEHDYSKALKHISRINPAEVNLEIVEMVLYRKAEIYYNLGDFDQATELFFQYRENCDNGTFVKCEFRDDALDFLAVAFADMGNGGEAAEKFFKKAGSRPYEAFIFYTIGFKNRKHGQYDDAIVSLSTALSRFPYYKDAPLAQQNLVECYLIKKEYEKANGAREALVDDYRPGSAWYQNNSGQRAAIERSQSEVKRALASIAIYNHALAQKKKDKALFEKALSRYLEFFKKFPDDKWRVFEFKFYVAEIYNTLHQYDKAAGYYKFVASQDLSTYPDYMPDIDTVGLDQEELEKAKKDAKEGPKSISQEDAGYNVIVALDNARKKVMAENGWDDKQAFTDASTTKFLDYIKTFAQRFPQSANAADVLYLAGNVYYSAESYENAIREFQYLVNNFPTHKIAGKALRMLANSYANSGNFDLAMAKYRELLSKQTANTPEYAEVVDLVAGAMYKKAEGLKKSGNMVGAADAFKAIAASYPTSKVADRGWFEAAVCYEEGNSNELASATFESLADKFPKSDLREKSFVRAAESLKKQNKWENAAQVYVKAANTINKPEFAIGSLASASECYQKIEKFDLAGKMYKLIYQRYADDPKTPQALYNAGLIFEKGKFYSNAISVYEILTQKFPKSEFCAEALFSIGLCYEKMGKKTKMAGVFSDYARKYPTDRYKQVQALVKAGDAYYDIKDKVNAEKNYTLATVVYKEYSDKADIDVESVARAYFQIGEMKYQEFSDVKLTGRSESVVKKAVARKTDALAEAAKPYAKAIELGVEKWTVKATYMIGMGFVDMAAAVEKQTLFGSSEQKIASQIRILSSLEKYYSKAQDYFYKNIEWAYDQGFTGENINISREMFMKMLYLKGNLLERVGETFKKAPVPRGLSPEEKQAYQELLEEKYLESLDAALPKYEEAVKIAAQAGIAKSIWLDKIRERIRTINPASEALSIQIVERQPKSSKTSAVTASSGADGTVRKSLAQEAGQELERSLRRVANIMSMNISVEDKIKQLNRIEMEAKRNILMEEERINELKKKSGKS